MIRHGSWRNTKYFDYTIEGFDAICSELRETHSELRFDLDFGGAKDPIALFKQGENATSDMEFVTKRVEIANSINRPIASPEEAASIFGYLR